MRLDLATDLRARIGAPDKDARLTNAFVEVNSGPLAAKNSAYPTKKETCVRKRPGCVETDYNYTTAQGMVGAGGLLYMIYGDYLASVWVPGATYSTGDVVAYHGVLWDYSGATSGESPSDGGWTLKTADAGWEMVGSSLPESVLPAYNGAAATTSGVIVSSTNTQNSYISTDGATWSSASPWTGTGLFTGVRNGWSDGTYVWHALGMEPVYWEIGIDKTTLSAMTYAGSGVVDPHFVEDFDQPELYKIGSTLFVRGVNSGTVAQFVSSPDSAISWTLITSNLPHADCSKIVVMGSTAYSIPPGGASGTKVYASTDFATWTIITSDWGLGSEETWLVAKQNYGSKIVVLLASDNVATSTDGISWAVSDFYPHTLHDNIYAEFLCEFGGDWYALGITSWAKLQASRVP